MNAIYIEVSAAVRYWEDATVNGQEDTDGKLMPLTQGSYWVPVIRLADGQIMNWPNLTERGALVGRAGCVIGRPVVAGRQCQGSD